jgi:hypothetical protein
LLGREYGACGVAVGRLQILAQLDLAVSNCKGDKVRYVELSGRSSKGFALVLDMAGNRKQDWEKNKRYYDVPENRWFLEHRRCRFVSKADGLVLGGNVGRQMSVERTRC